MTLLLVSIPDDSKLAESHQALKAAGAQILALDATPPNSSDSALPSVGLAAGSSYPSQHQDDWGQYGAVQGARIGGVIAFILASTILTLYLVGAMGGLQAFGVVLLSISLAVPGCILLGELHDRTPEDEIQLFEVHQYPYAGTAISAKS